VICPEPSELQELVRDLHRQATPWLPAGSGSRLAWGPAVQAGPGQSEPLVLSTARLNRILSFSPEDFTVTVQAGTPLVALQQREARRGSAARLPLVPDPPLEPRSQPRVAPQWPQRPQA
jgi:glycolate oxidase FAD binding subunit